MNVAQCLQRIGADRPQRANLESLSRLQQAFLLRVPFENLDIHYHRRISLDPEDIHHKLVAEHRGGFCYECNGLFADLLTALGFEVVVLSARMRDEHGSPAPEFSHMILQVSLDTEYLVDVGNGQSFREPLRLDGGNTVTAEAIEYRIATHGDGLALCFRAPGADWAQRFLFTRTPRARSEFAGMCDYYQTAPESYFVKRPLATIARPDGRTVLSGMHLSIRGSGRDYERELRSAAEFEAALVEHFGIDMNQY